MKLSKKAENLKDRYLRFGITDMQLKKYKDLGVLTQDEFDYIKSLRDMDETK